MKQNYAILSFFALCAGRMDIWLARSLSGLED